ncbi:zf-PARP-domain-containing protein [Amylocystis lapponica]|nr:zf-PARP-domain-containing protein [Amylocystis lapponica]
MSDTGDDKKSGYRLEYAPSARGKCKGPKPCQGTAIGKGELRVGSLVDFRGNSSFSWRHWGCVTETLIKNMKKSFEDPDDLDGFDELSGDDQEKIRKAWEEGHVADEDIPESARKSGNEDEEEEDEDKPKAKKAGAKASKKKDEGDGKGVFKLEYASSGRSKCKECGENVGKDFFRLGNEVEFRGNKSFAWRHWGCADKKMVTSLKASYAEPSEIEGFGDLKDDEKEKVRRAWEEGEIPEDDKGPGEAVDTGKKAVRRKKKAEDGEESEKPKRSRAKKAKKGDDDEEDEEEEKPKRKRAPAKPAAEKKGKAPAKKRASKKKEESEEDGEDFGDEIAAVGADDDDEEEEVEEVTKKRKRAPPSKASSSKPPSKKAKSSAKPVSRGRKKQEEIVEESELEEDD